MANNCVGYEQEKDIISTIVHLKLTGNNYFKNFPKAQTYIQPAANSSGGFKLLYRIMDNIHQRLRLKKGVCTRQLSLHYMCLFLMTAYTRSSPDIRTISFTKNSVQKIARIINVCTTCPHKQYTIKGRHYIR